jgi:hypothetical protein
MPPKPSGHFRDDAREAPSKRPEREPNKFENEGTERSRVRSTRAELDRVCRHLHQGGNSTRSPPRALRMIRKLLKVPNFHIVRAGPHENSALLPLLACRKMATPSPGLKCKSRQVYKFGT